MKVRTLLSGGGGVLLFAVFLVIFPPHDLWGALRGVNLSLFAVGLVAIVLALVCWSEALYALLEAGERATSHSRTFAAFGTGTLGKQLFPLGNAGGPALLAYAVSRDTASRYEETFAVVTISEFFGLLAMVILSLGGVVVLLYEEPTSNIVHTLGLAVVALAVTLLVGVTVVVLRRNLVEAAVLGIVRLLRRTIGSHFPIVKHRLAAERTNNTVQRYYATVDVVGNDRRALVTAFVLALAGHVCFLLPLYTSALALGIHLPFALAVFVASVGGLAAFVPVPGGLGSVEIALVGLLVSLAGIDPMHAAALALCFRLCTYWFLLLAAAIASIYSRTRLSRLTTDFDAQLK